VDAQANGGHHAPGSTGTVSHHLPAVPQLCHPYRQEYSSDLADLLRYLETINIRMVRDVGLSHLEGYLAELDRRGYAGSTRKRRTATIRAFFSFLQRTGLVANDVARRLIPPYSELTTPRVLTQSEYNRLLEACSQSLRDIALVELLLQTGIRLSELVHLKRSDLDLPKPAEPGINSIGQVRITTGGGRKSCCIPLNEQACLALRRYLEGCPATPTGTVFINRFGKPLGPRGIQKLIKKYLDQIGVRGASVHSLRHTFGAQHAAQGTSLKTIQEAMGHKDMRTTSQYLSLAQLTMREELQAHAL
jgi:integrase/recombinase XerD